MVCKKCGVKNLKMAVFCEECGSRLKPVKTDIKKYGEFGGGARFWFLFCAIASIIGLLFVVTMFGMILYDRGLNILTKLMAVSAFLCVVIFIGYFLLITTRKKMLLWVILSESIVSIIISVAMFLTSSADYNGLVGIVSALSGIYIFTSLVVTLVLLAGYK